jgi:hypothetical protein
VCIGCSLAVPLVAVLLLWERRHGVCHGCSIDMLAVVIACLQT